MSQFAPGMFCAAFNPGLVPGGSGSHLTRELYISSSKVTALIQFEQKITSFNPVKTSSLFF